MRADQVAEVLGIDKRAVYKLHASDDLEGVMVGKRRLRFRHEAVHALIERSGRAGTS
jgi:excisionase family DNA binding protein